jgi:hypothetical protein
MSSDELKVIRSLDVIFPHIPPGINIIKEVKFSAASFYAMRQI